MHFPDSATHQKVSNLLALFHPKTLIQKNIFDGTNKELTSNLPVLLRFYNLEQHCVLSLKAKPVISAGISRMAMHALLSHGGSYPSTLRRYSRG
ncbi:hypothetical protein GmHk_02G003863 [Glycine max]|uniref:Uncharacterized protein n=1 Tax=Glycine soja TaxID=3848 RepID=A0A0B2R5U8_GLYSO|nr:hypothetical protein GmHk_02G003863 [Glycine max]KHN27197.1 hypothetical protein glysoja_025481 [Glycine soja]